MESEQHFAGTFTAEYSVHFSNPGIRELLDEFLKIPVSTTFEDSFVCGFGTT